MKLFLDSANIDEIKKVNELGVISGVTTNPSLIAKEGRDFKETIREIASTVSGPVFAEVVSPEADGMVTEAEKLASIAPNVVIKIPMTEEGLKAVSRLSAGGIKTNVTLVFSPSQALLAANAGASYVSSFVGRLDDVSNNGLSVIGDIASIFRLHRIETEVLAASIRGPQDVTDAALRGASVATVPFKVIMQMIKHPLTDDGLRRFEEDWRRAGMR